MKKIIALLCFLPLLSNAQVKVLSNGNMGIGTLTPAELFELKSTLPVVTLHLPNVATYKMGVDNGLFKIVSMENGYGGHTGSFANNDTQGLLMKSNGYVGIGESNPTSALHVTTYWGNQLRLVSTRGGQYNTAGIDFCSYNGTGISGRIAAEDQGSWRGNLVFYCNGEGVSNSTNLRKVFQVDYLGNSYLYGVAYQQQSWMWSDRSIKENIITCSDALNKIKLMRGVIYDAKDTITVDDMVPATENSSKSGQVKVKIPYGKCLASKKQYGLIAQEVEAVIPEAVSMSSMGIKVVNYNAVIPVLIEALKDQSNKIESLEFELQKLKKGNKAAREAATNTLENGTAYLFQNTPNPFSTETTIKYVVPVDQNEAFITLNDLNGKQLKLIQISSKGEGFVTLKANELTAGIYLYTLVTNGNIVDTKRMIIVE